jgi:type 2 lantibiotic biosynthesis protein LanM
MSRSSEPATPATSAEPVAPAEPAAPAASWNAAFDVFTDADWSAIRARVSPGLAGAEWTAIGRRVIAEERDLLRALCLRTLVLELNCARLLGELVGDTPEQRFVEFASRFGDPRRWAQLFEEYAVLGAAVATVRRQFCDQVVELCDRLAGDLGELVAHGLVGGPAPRLVGLDASLSDPHRGGRGVWKLVFAAGGAEHTVMYKPKPLAVDATFQRLVARCNAAIARGEVAGVPPLRVLGVLDRGDYGWVEYLSTPMCDDEAAIARFYRRQGALLALLHVLLGTDIHHENLIAHGEHPVIVDLETLFHPFVIAPDPTGSARGNAEAALEHSVLRIGLLPWRALRSDDSPGINVGALGDGEVQPLPFPVPRWAAAGRDDMRLIDQPGVLSLVDNLPRLAGRRVPYFEHVTEIVAGFEAMARHVVRRRAEWLAPGGALDEFAADPVRYVVRPTSTYEKVLHATGHPDHLRTTGTAVHVRNALDATGDPIARDPGVRAAEDADLAARDIPYFSGRPGSAGVWDSRGVRLGLELPAPMLDVARGQLAAFDDAEVDRQLWCTRAALAAAAFGHPAPGLATAAPARAAGATGPVAARAVALAAELGTRLADRAIVGADGATWIGLIDGHADSFTLGALGPDLYDGVAGIAVFFAALGRTTGEPRFAALADQAAKHVRAELTGRATSTARAAPGGFVGVPSQLYALAHVGDAALAPALPAALDRLDDLAGARDADIIYGAAGAILGLLAAYQVTRREAILPHLLAALDLLERTALPQPDGVAWLNHGFARPLLGFSHGSAGIACALARLGAVLAGEGHAAAAARCTALAAGARRYERAWFDARRRNWPDFRAQLPDGKNLIAWCHGAPGVAVSRLAGELDAQTLAELDTAIATTLDADPPAVHTLCHGGVGNLAIVAHAAARLGRDDWRRRVDDRLPALIDDVAHRLTLDTAFADAVPGLMTGIAGIGCGLLALADPAAPFVLGLEPPPR